MSQRFMQSPAASPDSIYLAPSKRASLALVLSAGFLAACPNDDTPTSTDTASATGTDASGITGLVPTTGAGTDSTLGTTDISTTGVTASSNTNTTETTGTETTGQVTTTDSPPIPVCGNGMVEGREECDDGDAVDYNACSNECKENDCKNGMKLLASDQGLGDYFGHSVDISANHIAIGAWGGNYGSAYVFEMSPNGIMEKQVLFSSDVQEQDRFGYSIAIDGNTIVSGAPSHHNGDIYYGGAAYIFEKDGDQWIEKKILIPPDGTQSDYFGSNVAIKNNIIAATSTDSEKALFGGAVYIYKKLGGNWTYVQKLMAQDLEDGDQFGYSVAIDNQDTFFIGSPFDDDKGENSGSVYVFNSFGDSWTQVDKISPLDGNSQNLFGHDIAVDDNILVIGSPHNFNGGEDFGSFYVFSKDGNDWQQAQKLAPADTEKGTEFGHKVALDKDKILVGAQREDANEYFAGTAYIFANNGTWSEQKKLIADDGGEGDFFGSDVATENGIFVVGAKDDTNDFYWTGSVYVYCQ